jgi:peptide-methionine (S)-S-oxide reductase
MPGYSGGTVKNPTYEEVCTGDTGHAEVTRIKFEPARISYGDLLKVFFATHNPTTVNRQGNDTGPQYRSVIFYTTTAQRIEAEKFIRDLKSIYRINAVTRVEPLVEFYPAEDYHRNYYLKNQNAPYCQFVIDPKLAKLREQFKYLLNI